MIELYIDAATAGNPGPSAIGIFIKGEGQLIKIGESIGENDNHTTEFIALVRGLTEALKLSTGMISVRSDSKIVVASIEKEYVKNEAYKPYLEEALELSKNSIYFSLNGFLVLKIVQQIHLQEKHCVHIKKANSLMEFAFCYFTSVNCFFNCVNINAIAPIATTNAAAR